MKTIATILSLLLASSSFAFAQSSGSGTSVTPPNTQEIPAAKPSGTAATTTGASGNTQRTDPSNPTNALEDNRVSRTTGNPGLQTGPVK
jgi:hypothetical protein